MRMSIRTNAHGHVTIRYSSVIQTVQDPTPRHAVIERTFHVPGGYGPILEILPCGRGVQAFERLSFSGGTPISAGPRLPVGEVIRKEYHAMRKEESRRGVLDRCSRRQS